MDDQTQQVLERIRRFAMPGGPVQCKGAWLQQKGEMRFAPDRPWFPFEAEQWFRGSGIDFEWRARARMARWLPVDVVDAFEGGRGELTARLLRVFPVARARGPETDRGEAMRGLAELAWRPFAFREGAGVTWEARTAELLRATYDDGRTRAEVELEVDGEGRVLGMRAGRRPRMVGKSVVDTAWSGSFRAHELLDGLRVPTEAEVTWHLPGGPFTYWRARVTGFRAVR